MVDLGSLSTRLLITDGRGRSTRRQVVTRLWAGAGPDGSPAPEALDRVRAVLEGFAAEIAAAGAGQVAAVGTAAVRRAPDPAPLRALVAETLGGVGLRVLDGGSEARLAFAGARHAVAHRPGDVPLAVLDIGGGSTELSVGDQGGLRSSWSADIGAISATEAHLHGDPPTPWELAAALSVVELHVDDMIREIEGLGDVLRDGTVIGVGGTITTVAAVEVGLLEHDPDRIEGMVLTRGAVEDVFRTLATERAVDRAHNPGLPADRVDLIVGGCCVLVEILRRLGIDELVVSGRDLLDGVAAELLERS